LPPSRSSMSRTSVNCAISHFRFMCTYLEGKANLTSGIRNVKSSGVQEAYGILGATGLTGLYG
jgi:hypothetical protein